MERERHSIGAKRYQSENPVTVLSLAFSTDLTFFPNKTSQGKNFPCWKHPNCRGAFPVPREAGAGPDPAAATIPAPHPECVRGMGVLGRAQGLAEPPQTRARRAAAGGSRLGRQLSPLLKESRQTVGILAAPGAQPPAKSTQPSEPTSLANSTRCSKSAES